MQHARPCSFCGEADHVEWHCPELVAPIRDTGMMKPPSGQPMNGGDDDRCPMHDINTTYIGVDLFKATRKKNI